MFEVPSSPPNTEPLTLRQKFRRWLDRIEQRRLDRLLEGYSFVIEGDDCIFIDLVPHAEILWKLYRKFPDINFCYLWDDKIMPCPDVVQR